MLFKNGVHTYIWYSHSRVRSDKGRENVLLVDYMIKERGPGRDFMITGPNTQ